MENRSYLDIWAIYFFHQSDKRNKIEFLNYKEISISNTLKYILVI